ncbi:MAG: cell envelope integrity protein CreD [Chitinophagaceae bacterium]
MQTQQPPSFWQRNATFLKAIVVGFLILVLMIPNAFITELVRERQERQKEIIAEVSSKWASGQKLTGPFLLLPYWETSVNEKGQTVNEKETAYFLPEQLLVNGELFPEVRHRSIFEVMLYKSDLKISGSFTAADVAALGINPEKVIWSEARFCIGLSDNRGISEQLRLKINDQVQDMNAGLPSNHVTTSGVNTVLPEAIVRNAAGFRFAFDLKLKGSESLYFTPVGKETKVQLHSTFTEPSFTGKFLPTSSPVNKEGFKAEWNVLHFTRDFPQSWKEEKANIDEYAFGVQLLQGVDSYSKTMRTVKYALLFIALTFCLYFFIELLQKRRIHPLQYVLVGFALSIFYTLLLSIGEYVGFNISYAIASVATITLITLYTRSIFQKWNIALALMIFLSALYGFIYILIQLQDGALLFGSIGLFVLLAIVMYYSRKVDWYGDKQEITVSE